MVKNILNILLNVLAIVLVYLLQIYVANNVLFFGINANLVLMYVAIIAMLYSFKVAVCIGSLIGILTDLVFYTTFGKYTIIYILVTIMVSSLKKIYKEDNKISVIIASMLATLLCETILYIFNICETGNIANVIYFIWNTLKLSLVNICFAYILYLILRNIYVGKN